MEKEVIHYRDAYGQRATAVRNIDTGGKSPKWKLTFLRGRNSYTRVCLSESHIRIVLEANGCGWTEVDRWHGRTIRTA